MQVTVVLPATGATAEVNRHVRRRFRRAFGCVGARAAGIAAFGCVEAGAAGTAAFGCVGARAAGIAAFGCVEAGAAGTAAFGCVVAGAAGTAAAGGPTQNIALRTGISRVAGYRVDGVV